VERSLVVIVNPTSGGGRGARWGVATVQLLKDHGLHPIVVIGADADHAARRALDAIDRLVGAGTTPAGIVAVGGDGLVHLALNAALEHDLPIGVVPAGTGNDFARAVGVHASTLDAAVSTIVAAMRHGDLPRVDLGQIDGGPAFGCVLSIGFDATVNARANRFTRLRGRARYPIAMLVELRRFSPLDCLITVDGVQRRHRAMLIAIGNGSSYGGGMRICPSATVADEALDVTVVDEIGVAELLRLFPRVYTGRHMEHPKAHGYRGREVRVEFADGAVPPVFADGEPMSQYLASGSLAVTVRPRAVRLLTPALT